MNQSSTYYSSISFYRLSLMLKRNTLVSKLVDKFIDKSLDILPKCAPYNDRIIRKAK